MSKRSSGSRSRPMVFVALDSGCVVPLSHNVDKDGYLVKTWTEGVGVKAQESFHRFIYRAQKGEIPEGHEVDHICRNPSCCNSSHLQTLSRSDHLKKTFNERFPYRLLKDEAREFWLRTKCSAKELRERYGMGKTSSHEWIKAWRQAL